MKYFVTFLWMVLSTSLAFSQTVEHTVKWEKGVNERTVKGWIGSLSKVGTDSSTTYIRKKSGGKDKLHRKGHRDVIVWIPKSTDFTKKFTIVIWFHGHYGYVPRRTYEDRILKQFSPLVKSKNFIVAIPEMPWSIHTKTPTKRNSLVWQKPTSFLRFVAQIHEILIEHNSGRFFEGEVNAEAPTEPIGKVDYKVVGHSAGGSTIKRLGITGDLCRLNPSVIVWSDSSYGKWLDDAWDGCLKKTSIPVKVLVVRGGSPHNNASRFIKRFKSKPKNIELQVKGKGWSHKLVGNNSVKLSNLMEL